MKIGYIGLGALGNELAKRFLSAHELWVWDLSPAAVAHLQEAGARVADSPAALAREVDIVLTCLPRSDDVWHVLFGPNGLAEELAAGKIVIDQTSGVPQETNRIAARLAKRRVSMLDAAVSASPQIVPQGLATLMVAGPKATYDQALPVLKEITKTIYYCGSRVGDGQATKMINNAMNCGARMGTLELVAMARKAGLTLGCLTAVLNKGGGANLTTEKMLPAIAQGKSATNFALALQLKDVNQAITLGMDLRVPMPITAAVRSLVQTGLNLMGEKARLDDMIGVIEKLAAVTFKDGPSSADPMSSAPRVGSAEKTVGECGLLTHGTDGLQQLARSGPLRLYDESAKSHEQRAEEGLTWVASIKALAEECDIIFLSLPAISDVHDALFGERGMSTALSEGTVVVNMTNAPPAAVREIESKLRALGVALIDASIVKQAVQGNIAPTLILASGSRDAFEQVAPILRKVCAEVEYCGTAPGAAQVARLLNSAVTALCRHVAYECVAMGRKFGLRLVDMSEILAKCSGWSAASRELLPLLVTGREVLGATVDEVASDLQHVARLSMEVGAPTTIINQVRSLFEVANNDLAAGETIARMTSVIEELSGVEFKEASLQWPVR